MRSFLICLCFLCLSALPAWSADSPAPGKASSSTQVSGNASEPSGYVGSASCGSCHEEQYARFQEQSKKAKSWDSVKIMAPKLTPEELKECYTCHTTGYGKGGFVDYASTPQFADVGCETCHGPGARHAESGDPADIMREPSESDCLTCHNSSRVKAFNFKPLIHSGAH